MKKDGSNLINKLLFQTYNEEKNCIKPGLILYCRQISTCLLANQYNLLGIVNRARTIVYRVIYLKSKSILYEISKINMK